MKIKLFDKTHNKVIEGREQPFMLDLDGNIYLMTSRQGDGGLEFILCDKGNIIIQEIIDE